MENLRGKTARLLWRATLIAGTLDLLSAMIYMLIAGRNPLAVPVGIASAVWPGALRAGAPALAVGVLLHFAIMLAMVAIYVGAARRLPWLSARPVASGALYGLLLWAVMNLVVLPLRWPALFPHVTAVSFAEQIFSHVALVGLPLAWMTRKALLDKGYAGLPRVG
jgi:hypothetical protein